MRVKVLGESRRWQQQGYGEEEAKEKGLKLERPQVDKIYISLCNL